VIRRYVQPDAPDVTSEIILAKQPDNLLHEASVHDLRLQSVPGRGLVDLGKGFPDRYGDSDRNESFLRVKVVLFAFVHDPDVSVCLRLLVGHYSVYLVPFKRGGVALVVDADDESWSRLSRRVHNQSKYRFRFISRRPMPCASYQCKLCSPDTPVAQPDQGAAFEFAPAGATIQPIKPRTVSNAQAPRNRLDGRDLADDAKLIHVTLCHTPRKSSIPAFPFQFFRRLRWRGRRGRGRAPPC